jgi:hypothetical protein
VFDADHYFQFEGFSRAQSISKSLETRRRGMTSPFTNTSAPDLEVEQEQKDGNPCYSFSSGLRATRPLL